MNKLKFEKSILLSKSNSTLYSALFGQVDFYPRMSLVGIINYTLLLKLPIARLHSMTDPRKAHVGFNAGEVIPS